MVPEKSPLEDTPRDGEKFFKLVFEIKLKKMSSVRRIKV